MICRCGPRHSTRLFASDAARAPRVKSQGSDPTGTLPLQRRFQRDLTSRWDALRRTIPNFVTARTDLATTILHASITGQDPVRAFQKWFDTAVKMVVVGDGRWMNKYAREAGDAAIMRAGTLTQVVGDAKFDESKHPRDKEGQWTNGIADLDALEKSAIKKKVIVTIKGKTLEIENAGKSKHRKFSYKYDDGYLARDQVEKLFSKDEFVQDVTPITHDRIPPLQTLCHTELQGIAEATSQQAVRAFANGLLKRETPAQIARDVQQIIDQIAKKRSDLLVSFIVVRAFGAATLDAYRAAGITHVGTVAERIPSAPVLMRDAKPKTKSKGTKKPKDLVEVLTAGDDKVCQICEDISEEGPYTLAEAEALIPAHPRCRCSFVPWHDARFAHDAFDPNQPRDKDGKFISVKAMAKQQQLVEAMQRDHAQWATVSGLQSWKPPSDANWRDVQGQNNHIQEPPLPDLKRASYSYVDKVTGETRTHQPKDLRLSSGVIMREPDGRVWLVKPTNNFGGYNYTFPKGGVEDDLSPQANAIKEAYEESGLKARIVGHAGDYRGDTSVTRMYHAVREDGHPKDHGWETESVALVHPHEVHKYLNRSRDLKIAKHHLSDEFNPDLHPRDKDGKFAAKGTGSVHLTEKEKMFSKELEGLQITHYVNSEGEVPSGNMFEVRSNDVQWVKTAALNKNVKLTHLGELNEEGTHHGFVVEPTVRSAFDPEPAPAHIDMKDLTKISGKKGNNEGGVYEDGGTPDSSPKQYYIKTPKTKDHVQNELTAAALYKAAGVNTMEYVPVKGGEHVATVLQHLDKDNIAHFTADERHEAQKDFAVHAWLANWDAAGTGGDNQVIVGGKVTTVDTGGSLKYRAQGEPKGEAFGNVVHEMNTLRDPSKSPDAAALYGSMTNAQLKESIARVTSIPDHEIANIVAEKMVHSSVSEQYALTDKLIARKENLAVQAEKLTVPPATPTPLEKHEAEPKIFKTKTEHIKHLLMQGTTSEELKSKMGWKAVSMPQQAATTGLMLEITKKNGKNFYKGIPLAAEDLAAIKQQAVAPTFGKAPAAEIKSAPVVVPISTQTKVLDPSKPSDNFEKMLKEQGVKYHANAGKSDTMFNVESHHDVVELAHKYHPNVQKLSKFEYYAPNENHNPSLTELESALKNKKSVVVHPPATEAELTKAKKNLPLQSQYVPGFADVPAAHALLAEFNKKYEGKVLTSPEDLQAKVNAFKDLTAAMAPLQSEQQKAQAAAVAKSNAETAVKNAALQAAAKAKKDAEAAAEEAKMADPVYKAHIKALEGIGIDKQQLKYAQNVIDEHKLNITAAEGTAIRAYVGSSYTNVNAALREGKKMSLKQIMYAQTLNDALQKMPVYAGDVVRGLDSSLFPHYADNVGSVVTEHAFTSAGVKGKLWGDATLYIKSIRARDIRAFNPGEGGGEVVFRKGSHFHIIKVDSKTKSVWMEEI